MSANARTATENFTVQLPPMDGTLGPAVTVSAPGDKRKFYEKGKKFHPNVRDHIDPIMDPTSRFYNTPFPNQQTHAAK